MKIYREFEHGSEEWQKIRCGKVTMSNAKALLTGGKGITRMNYIYDVVAERLSGQMTESYSGENTERGSFLEDHALTLFNAIMKVNFEPVGFVEAHDKRIGCTPDAIEIGGGGGVEIKCAKPRRHIHNCFGNGMDEYYPQVQGNMSVCESEYWYLVSFCPWVKQYPIGIERIVRDENMIRRIVISATESADMVDGIVLKAMQAQFSSQTHEMARKAAEEWEHAWSDNDQVTL